MIFYDVVCLLCFAMYNLLHMRGAHEYADHSSERFRMWEIAVFCNGDMCFCVGD